MNPTHEALRAAVARLREAGFTEDAADFDGIILRAHQSEIPPEVRHIFESMLSEVEKTWPGIRSRP